MRINGRGDMVSQLVKKLAVKPKHLGLVPRMHKKREEILQSVH